MAQSPMRPVPQVNALTAPFWESCSRGKLMLQRCTARDCRRFVFYPRVCCPYCHRGELEWVEASGSGRILSHTLVHRPQHEYFYPEAPIRFLAVELSEGPIIYGHLLDPGDHGSELTGQPVEVAMVEARPGLSLPSFRISAA